MASTAHTGAVAKTLRNGHNIARGHLARDNYGGSSLRAIDASSARRTLAL